MGKCTWTQEEHKRLIELINEGKSYKEISEILGTHSKCAVQSYANKNINKILIRTSKYSKDFKAVYQDYGWCYHNNVELGLTHEQMAEKAGCSKRVIEKWCVEKHGIKYETRFNEMKLNDKQHDLVIGSLLGDGHIDKREKYPIFIVSHAENQKDYLYYKYNIMKNLCASEPSFINSEGKIEIKGKKCHIQNHYRFITRSINELKKYRSMSISDVIDQLNNYSFSIWMLDDANRNDKGYWSLCFPYNEYVDYACKKIFEKFGFELIKKFDKDKNVYYLKFKAVDSRKLDKIILNHIDNSLDIIQYKIINGGSVSYVKSAS